MANACLSPRIAVSHISTVALSWTLARILATTPSMRQLMGAGALRFLKTALAWDNTPHQLGTVVTI